MVLLTMTPAIVDSLRTIDVAEQPESDEPSLRDPVVGKPISHGQIIDLWKRLSASDRPSHTLEQLLRGSQVYSPPAPPRPEPSGEYKALMARLRHEEAQRAYDRMVNPPPKIETFEACAGDDDVSLRDVHRQVMLIINFMVSILGVAATLWVTSRWWSVPARIFVTMAGSVVVAVAEVVVYSGYMWRMEEGKRKEMAVREVREVVDTWVVGGEDLETVLPSKEADLDASVRRRVVTAQQ